MCYPRRVTRHTKRPNEPEWSRLRTETDYLWACFLQYRDSAYPDGPLGAFEPRNMERLALQLGLQPSQLAEYADKYDWHYRAGCYDADIEGQKVDRSMTAIDRMRVRKEQALTELHRILQLERAKLLRRAEDPEIPALNARELTAMMDLVLKHEQMLADLPDRGAVTEDQGRIDLTGMPLSDLQHLEQIVKRTTKTRN
jgi:hypothetical protein